MSTLGSARMRMSLRGALVSMLFIGAAAVQSQPVRADSNEEVSLPVTERLIETLEPIPYPTLRKSSSESRSDADKAKPAGINGEQWVTYKVTELDGLQIKRAIVGSRPVAKKAPEIVNAMRFKPFASRGGSFAGLKVVEMIATGYSAHPHKRGWSATGRTATGQKVTKGIVAVDPRFIPLGTKMYIEGYGYAVAADTGGAIKGRRIDLAHDTHREAKAVGRRTVRVHILP